MGIVVQSVKKWLETIVISLNLCPFAKRELNHDRIHFAVTEVVTEQDLLCALEKQLLLLNNQAEIETTLLIHPNVLNDFQEYNQFLDLADNLLAVMSLRGIYQIASFHPNYQFANTESNDPENYTNRSPYPMLHILREDSLEKAIASHADTHKIPKRNITLMNQLGQKKLKQLLADCLEVD